MKKIIRILMVVAVAMAFACVNSVADSKEGKHEGPRAVPGESAKMTCPTCKDDYVVKHTKPPKGTESEKVILVKHLCQKCGTKLVTRGGGKAKTEVAEHTCKDCK